MAPLLLTNKQPNGQTPCPEGDGDVPTTKYLPLTITPQLITQQQPHNREANTHQPYHHLGYDMPLVLSLTHQQHHKAYLY